MQPQIFQDSWYETIKSQMSSCPNAEQIQSSTESLFIFIYISI